MAKKTLADVPPFEEFGGAPPKPPGHGKRALVRVDFNVPVDKKTGEITNDRRIRAALPTIQHLLDQGAAVIVMSHLGRPTGDPKADAPYRMDRVAKRLGELLNRPTQKVDEVVGPSVKKAVEQLQPGGVLVLENLRFHPAEQDEGEQTDAFAAELASYGDVYVNDAFGTCHREDASMLAVPKAMAGKPRVVGTLVAKELEILEKLMSSPPRPGLGILGGAKVSDKMEFIKSLLQRVDRVLVGGAMTYTFMKAQGKGIGKSRCEADKLDVAGQILARGKDKILFPVDHLVVQDLKSPESARVVEGDIPEGWIGVDVGPKTIAAYTDEVKKAGTVVWNGPLGKFEDEPYSKGTRAMADALSQSSAVTVVGGGETAEAVEEFGLADKMTHVSTGGGAFLEYFQGSPFPALAQIDER